MTQQIYTPEEIYAIADSGKRVTAVKMLRSMTNCGLKEAVEAIDNRAIEAMPDFETQRHLKACKNYASELYAVLTIIIGAGKLENHTCEAAQNVLNRINRWNN